MADGGWLQDRLTRRYAYSFRVQRLVNRYAKVTGLVLPNKVENIASANYYTVDILMLHCRFGILSTIHLLISLILSLF